MTCSPPCNPWWARMTIRWLWILYDICCVPAVPHGAVIMGSASTDVQIHATGSLQSMRLTLKTTKTMLLLLLALLLGRGMPGVLAQPAQQSVLVAAVEAVGLTVADMDRSVTFYTNVLAFEPV